MKHLSNIDTIAAYGRLLEFSSNKRYGVINNKFSDNAIDRIALEFNQKIYQKEGLDIRALEDNILITKYEDIVDDLLTKFTYEHIIEKGTSDEKKFLNNCIVLPEDIFNLNSFELDIADDLKNLLKEYRWTSSNPYYWTIDSIIEWCKTPSYVYGHLYEEKKNHKDLTDIFLNKTVSIKGKERIFFAHIRITPNTFNKKGRLQVIGFFSKDKFENLFSLPTELFLKYIEIYGNLIELLGNQQRFFYELKISNIYPDLYKDPFKMLKITSPGKDKIQSKFSGSPYNLDLYILVNTLYSIRIEENLKDTSSGEI